MALFGRDVENDQAREARRLEQLARPHAAGAVMEHDLAQAGLRYLEAGEGWRGGGQVAGAADPELLAIEPPQQGRGRVAGDQLSIVEDRDPVPALLGFLPIVGGPQ